MQAQQKLFIIAWSAVVVVFIGIMVIAYASLFPHFKEIGDWMVWLVRLLMVCAGCLAVTGTWFKIVSMHHESRYVKRDDVVTYHGRNKPYVVSADNFAAKLPPVTVPALPSPDIRWDAVLDLRKKQHGMHAIADMTKIPYNKVRAFLNQVEGNKSET